MFFDALADKQLSVDAGRKADPHLVDPDLGVTFPLRVDQLEERRAFDPVEGLEHLQEERKWGVTGQTNEHPRLRGWRLRGWRLRGWRLRGRVNQPGLGPLPPKLAIRRLVLFGNRFRF